MEIVIIGTGNTAHILGHKLKKAGHRIIQVFGRDSNAASRLAYELETVSGNYWNIISKSADIYIVAVSDIAISEVVMELKLQDKVIVHTAGSVSINILKDVSSRYGVFYPLQSLKKGLVPPFEMPIILDASDEQTLSLLESLGNTISDRVERMNDEQRLKLHLAAVFCNNFVNYLYSLAENYCKAEGINFKLLLPLIKETADRIQNISPSEAQTGPALRNDQVTIQKHIRMLQDYPELEKFYTLFSQGLANKG